MKNAILTILVASIMLAAFWYGLNKTIDNRCDYYMSQAHPTPSEIELCK